MSLLDRTACRTIGDIHAREFERPPTVVTAASVELRGMVREGEPVSPKKPIEAYACGGELRLRLFESLLRDQRISKTPSDLGIAARQRPPEQRLRLARFVLARVDLRQVHTRFYISRQVGKGALIPLCRKTRGEDRENATLKVYKGAPHGMSATLKDQINADLLAFFRQNKQAVA
jgi:hypothetical protein